MPVHVPLQFPAGASASAASAVGTARGLADDLGIGAFLAAVLLWVLLLGWMVRSETASRLSVPARASGVEDAQRSLAEHFVAGDMTIREFLERGSALDWTPGPEWSRSTHDPRSRTAAPGDQSSDA